MPTLEEIRPNLPTDDAEAMRLIADAIEPTGGPDHQYHTGIEIIRRNQLVAALRAGDPNGVSYLEVQRRFAADKAA